MGARALVILAILLVPTAAAWPADLTQGLAPGLHLKDSLLAAGRISTTIASNTSFGAERATGLFLSEGATVTSCPFVDGHPDTSCGSQPGAPNAHATIRILSGGVVVAAPDASLVNLTTPAGAAALGRADMHNLSTPRDVAGPAIAMGGRARLHAEGTAFTVRPFGRAPILEVRGDAGIQPFNGTATVLAVTNVTTLDLEAPAIFLLLPNGTVVDVGPAPLAVAEHGQGLEDLFALLREMTPPSEADRRADLAEAFGPFQVVPALLDGAFAAHRNATLNGVAQTELVFVRAPDARLTLEGERWHANGNGTLLVQGAILAADPESRVDPPLVLPLILLGLAIVARIFTKREPTPWKRRRQLALARLGGLLLLVLVAAQVLSGLVGFHPILDAGALSARSRAQIGLLVVILALVAYAMIGLSLESLARSALALRKRPAARFLPLVAGILGALVFLLVASAPLTSWAARFVRL